MGTILQDNYNFIVFQKLFLEPKTKEVQFFICHFKKCHGFILVYDVVHRKMRILQSWGGPNCAFSYRWWLGLPDSEEEVFYSVHGRIGAEMNVDLRKKAGVKWISPKQLYNALHETYFQVDAFKCIHLNTVRKHTK